VRRERALRRTQGLLCYCFGQRGFAPRRSSLCPEARTTIPILMSYRVGTPGMSRGGQVPCAFSKKRVKVMKESLFRPH